MLGPATHTKIIRSSEIAMSAAAPQPRFPERDVGVGSHSGETSRGARGTVPVRPATPPRPLPYTTLRPCVEASPRPPYIGDYACRNSSTIWISRVPGKHRWRDLYPAFKCLYRVSKCLYRARK